ncbi:Fe-S-oxidoreductase [bacterium]|nr:Fe-S-oxidoreductase [bacterium]
MTTTYNLPTGKLIVDDYSRGQLETLSIGDYGKSKNIKADFLGFTNELNGVPSGDCMPLAEKWVITLSTQYGCPMKCTFCDVPNIKFKGNASVMDLWNQFENAVEAFPTTKYTDRLNVHFARMGEPAFNADNIIQFATELYHGKADIQSDYGLRLETIHPVFTTSCPKTANDSYKVYNAVHEWCELKNGLYNGQAGLQLSINSTCDEQREEMYQGMVMSLEEIAAMGDSLPDPIGRKYCLNFAYSSDFIIDAEKLAKMFDSEKFMCKITPIHNNNACENNGIETVEGYTSFAPYKQVESDLKDAGFDVLVFVPSMDEEDGIVTCGNAILGGSEITADTSVLKIQGLEK